MLCSRSTRMVMSGGAATKGPRGLCTVEEGRGRRKGQGKQKKRVRVGSEYSDEQFI